MRERFEPKIEREQALVRLCRRSEVLAPEVRRLAKTPEQVLHRHQVAHLLDRHVGKHSVRFCERVTGVKVLDHQRMLDLGRGPQQGHCLIKRRIGQILGQLDCAIRGGHAYPAGHVGIERPSGQAAQRLGVLAPYRIGSPLQSRLRAHVLSPSSHNRVAGCLPHPGSTIAPQGPV